MLKTVLQGTSVELPQNQKEKSASQYEIPAF